ncbi:MAG: ABC transporter ATP-binding protein [Anaerolineaceae bacterium]|nr:ABC transporter ATP-binding protein [Anaerolineaceae bacterium]
MAVDTYFEEEEFTTQVNTNILLRLAGLMKPHKKWVIGFLLAITIVSGLEAVFTYISKLIVDTAILVNDKQQLIHLITIYGSLIIAQALSIFAFIYLTGILGERIRYDLRKMMFNHLQELSLSYFSKTPVGWIISRVTSDSDRVAELMTWGLLDVTWATFNILSSMVFMIIINWKLALFIFILLPLLTYIGIQFRMRILKEFRNVRKLNSKITASYNENITGVRVIKALVREEENTSEFKLLSTSMFRSGYRAAWLSALFLPTVQLITAVGLGGIIWYGGYQASIGGMTIGGIQAFITYITFMMWPISDLARVFAEMQHAVASAERIFSLVDSKADIVDQPNAENPQTIQGDIIFENVSFCYEGDEHVLKDFNLEVKRGETIALVGSTGGGKSTIVNLLCRFYEPKSGRIVIGDKDYTSISQHGLQSKIGMVPQTPHLFSGTIIENLRYGNLLASDEQIMAAAQQTGAHDFIVKFPNAYQQDVGEGGNLLSVGQKQLISLTRAVLADPEIFVMDEATSSIDTLTEALIQKGIEKLMHNRTSFIIAHRLSTIKHANRILVIEQGSIAESGSHEELLKQGGKYHQLYTRQFRRNLESKISHFQSPIKE